jgi:translation initiation factor eIF-2B subunit delta
MVFLGAHAVNSNGSVYSRAGTALVAMLAKEHSVPVLILSETYKYSNNIQLDSFTKNELGTPFLFALQTRLLTVAPAPIPAPTTSFRRITPREKLRTEIESENDTRNPNLQIINPLYDLTPHTHITVLVTEVGLIPPSAISTLAGLRDKDKGMQLSV